MGERIERGFGETGRRVDRIVGSTESSREGGETRS